MNDINYSWMRKSLAMRLGTLITESNEVSGLVLSIITVSSVVLDLTETYVCDKGEACKS
jgi:hypothetical protein